MSNLIYYTSPDPHLCALYHDKVLTEECMNNYAQLLLMSHIKLDGVASKIRIHQLFYLDDLKVVESPSLYWITFSRYHYEWLWECFVYLVVQYEKHINKTKFSSYLSVLEDCPHNSVSRGFKAPYPINPSSKENAVKYNMGYLNEVYSTLYETPPEWPWLPTNPEWYKGVV